MLTIFIDYIKRNFAIIISTIAFILSVFQMIEQRSHDKISVMPILTTYYAINGSNDDKKDGLYFYNGGPGNAIVKSIQVTVNGKVVDNDYFGPFFAAIKSLNLDPFCFIYRTPRQNDFIKKEEEVAFIEANKKSKASCAVSQSIFALKKGYQGSAEFDFKIHFKSIYNEKFTYHYRDNTQSKGWN